MKVGWIGELRRYSATMQRKSLIAFGVSEAKIYDETKGDTLKEVLHDASKGGTLVVHRLAALARSREGWRVFSSLMADFGKFPISEAATARTFDVSHDASEMVAGMVDDWAGNRMTDAQARAAGRAGAAKRWGPRDRTPIRTAAAIWVDWLKFPRPEDALGHPDMKGWKQGMAYKVLGARGAPAGPAGKRPKHKRLPPEPERGKGYIYFVQIDGRGPVKIGFAKDVKSRMAGLATSNHGKPTLTAVMRGTMSEEKALHKKFAKLRGNGEWFKMTGALRTFVKSLPPLTDD